MNGEKKQQTAVSLRRQVQCGKYWCTGLEVLGMKRLQRFFFMDKLMPKLQGCDNFPSYSVLQRARRIRRHPDRPGPTRATRVSSFLPQKEKVWSLLAWGENAAFMCTTTRRSVFVLSTELCCCAKRSKIEHGPAGEEYWLLPVLPSQTCKEHHLFFPFFLSLQFSKQYNLPGIMGRVLL